METSLQHTQHKGFFKGKSLDKLLKQTTQNSHPIAILPADQKETFCVLFFLFAIYKNSWEVGYYSLEYGLTLLANAGSVALYALRDKTLLGA